jgi:hypothetical protein
MSILVDGMVAFIAGSYLCLHAGYDNASKSLQVHDRLRLIFGFNNPSMSLVELNKALALTTMSVVSAAVFANCLYPNTPMSNRFIGYAGFLGLTHGLFSAIKYYKRYFGNKQVAMVFGALTLLTVLILSTKTGHLHFLNYIAAKIPVPVPVLVALAALLIPLHAGLMETNPLTNKLQMRPISWVGLGGSLLAAGVAIWGTVISGNTVSKY